MRTEAFILTSETRTSNGCSAIVLYCGSSHGPLELTCEYSPYFFALLEATIPPAVEALLTTAEIEPLRSFSGALLRKLVFRSIDDAEKARRILLDGGVALFESDVRPRERFLMDRGINGGVMIEGEGEKRGRLWCFKNPTLSPAQAAPSLRICSLDIETSISARTVLSIAVHLSGCGEDRRQVFVLGEPEGPDTAGLAFVATERGLLEVFAKWLYEADPDVIIGWNVIGFDLAYLKQRAAVLQIALPLGRSGRSFNVSENTGRFSRAYLPGRVVLDGPQLLRSSFYSFESYSLEHVSQQVLGEGKLIAPTDNRAWEIERLYKTDKRALARYNLKDAVLVTQIFEKLGLLELTVRRTQLSGMLLDQVGMSTASFDHFYLPRVHAEGYAAPDVTDIGEVEGAAGGYVMAPAAGLYPDIIGLDFRSLYPSIIRTFSIDPLARVCADADAIVTPKGFKFSHTRSILPGFIAELMDERAAAKRNGNKALSQAVKILMNSFYGVMGSAGCRFYHPALPDAITSTGQWLLMESKQRLENLGHQVIYGDTDSLFVQLSAERRGAAEDYAAEGRALASELNAWWRARLRREFSVESCLVLDFKKHYRKFLVPAARGGEGGAKKRYAGLVADGGREEVEFVGLEFVRSDWTRLARDFQLDLYTRIFREEQIDQWLREFVAKVQGGEFDEKLVYRKRLHKPLDEYGASPPPYVRAARMLPKGSRSVRYIMTTEGPVPVELSPKHPDYAHYIKHQLKPVADSILEVLGTSFDRVMSAQLRLF